MAAGLNVHRQGRRDGSALLMIHPLGADRRFWEPAASGLAGDFDLIACDLRSAGMSPVAGRPLAVADHVGDLRMLVDELRLDRFWVVGCAVGAVIAAGFAAAVRDRVDGVILTNPTVSFSKPAREMLNDRSNIILEQGMAAIVDQVIERAFYRLPPNSSEGFRRHFVEQPAQGYADLARGICTADISEDLGRIGAPALVISSPNDLLLPPDRADEVAALLPDATSISIEAAAHFIPYQAPGAFADMAREFTQRSMQH